MDFLSEIPVWAWAVFGFLILAVAGAVLGVWGWLFSFFSANPFLLLSVVGLVILVIALKSDHPQYALFGLGTVLIGIVMDFYAPPYSMACFVPSGQIGSFIASAGSSSFAIDTAVCKTFVELFQYNPVLLDLNFLGGVSASSFVFPIMMLFAVVFALLALIEPKFWASSIFLFAYSIVLLLVFDGQSLGISSITLASVVGYGLFPAVLYGVGSWLMFSILDD